MEGRTKVELIIIIIKYTFNNLFGSIQMSATVKFNEVFPTLLLKVSEFVCQTILNMND